MANFSDLIQRGTRASQPVVADVRTGTLYFVTDEGVTERSSGPSGAWQTFSHTVGEFLTAKTANETVNNSDTFQNDDHFSFAVAASEVWYIELTLLLESASTASDYKFQWTVPSGTTYHFGPDLLGSTVDSSVIYQWSPMTTGATPAALSTTLTAFGSASSGVCGAVIRTIMFVGGTAGTAQLQWAQNTTTAADSKILRGSFMKRHRII